MYDDLYVDSMCPSHHLVASALNVKQNKKNCRFITVSFSQIFVIITNIF